MILAFYGSGGHFSRPNKLQRRSAVWSVNFGFRGGWCRQIQDELKTRQKIFVHQLGGKQARLHCALLFSCKNTICKMEALFKSYCTFGAKDAAPLMDNAKFAKFARDTKILDKKLTSTDVDIIFSKVKA